MFEVKPWEAGADLVGLFQKISKEEIDGLKWGEAYKLVPVAFGVKKLVLSCVVVDSKVRTARGFDEKAVLIPTTAIRGVQSFFSLFCRGIPRDVGRVLWLRPVDLASFFYG